MILTYNMACFGIENPVQLFMYVLRVVRILK